MIFPCLSPKGLPALCLGPIGFTLPF